MKRILAFILVIGGTAVLFSTAFAPSSWSLNSFKTSKSEAALSSDIQHIQIDSPSISTTLVPQDRQDIKTKVEGKGKVDVKQNGDTLVVTYQKSPFQWLSIFSNTKVTIYIPRDYHHNLALTVGSGDLQVATQPEQALQLKDVSIKVGSGNASISNLRSTSLRTDVNSGDLQLSNVESQTAKFAVGSGEIKGTNYKGKLQARIGSGDLYMDFKKLEEAVSVDVGSGDAVLVLPKSAGFKVNGKVSSGDINNDFKLSNATATEDVLKGKHGNGKYPIDAAVSSGELTLKSK
ncbi:LiaG family protein [Priestia megaterium]|uniref:LiaG family protein n=1 Tax=Priestia megaterium TaxID=1404 RepID=UPI0031748D69